MTRMWGDADSRLDWLLFARASLVMATVVVMVRLLPYGAWRRLSLALGRVREGADAGTAPDAIVRAVDRASRVVPGGANCLVRALTTRRLLARHGLSSTLVLGVAKGSACELRAHAWLQQNGRILVGGQGGEGFLPMPDVDGRL